MQKKSEINFCKYLSSAVFQEWVKLHFLFQLFKQKINPFPVSFSRSSCTLSEGRWRTSSWSSSTRVPSLAMVASRLHRTRWPSWGLWRRTKKGPLPRPLRIKRKLILDWNSGQVFCLVMSVLLFWRYWFGHPLLSSNVCYFWACHFLLFCLRIRIW